MEEKHADGSLLPAHEEGNRTGSPFPIGKGESHADSNSERAAVATAAPQHPRRILAIAAWAVRICFAFVFAANVQCALGFALTPEAYMGAYELTGVAGRVAAQGIGIAFLMWNCTYPLVIWQPRRHKVLAGVVLAQQAVGLVGESCIRATLPTGHELLASSIDLFITFDALGLVLMGASLAALLVAERRAGKRSPRTT